MDGSGWRRSGRRGAPSAIGLAVVVLITLSVMAVATPATAIGIGGDTPIGMSPSALPNGQARSYFTLTVAAGQSTTDSVVVTNQGTGNETIKISPSLGVTSPQSGTAFQGYFKPCTSVACWVSGLPSQVTLSAGASQTLPFTVTVPAGTAPKQYLAGITAQPKTNPPPVSVGSNGKAAAKAIIIHQIDIGVAITVGSLAQMTTALVIPTVTSTTVGSTLRLGVGIQNQGQTFAKATGSAVCTSGGKQLTFPVNVDTVLPDQAAVVPVNTPGVAFGSSIPCTVSLTNGVGGAFNWRGTVSTPSTTPTTIIHTGPGVYSVVPVGGIPTWAVVLIVIGALVLIGIIVLLLVIRRRHRSAETLSSPGAGQADPAVPTEPPVSTVEKSP
jgi:hypothetical protein